MNDDDDTRGGAEKANFEARLQAARQRQGLEPTAADMAKGAGGAAPTALGVGMRVGVELVSAMVVALAIGWALDRWLHTTPLFIVLFVLLGGGAGIANVWRLMGPGRMPGGK
jgi:ATP synthase protein I